PRRRGPCPIAPSLVSCGRRPRPIPRFGRRARRSGSKPEKELTAMPRPAATTRASRTPALRVVRRTATAAAPPPAPRAVVYSKDDLLKRFAPLVRHVVERVAAT